MNYNQFMGSVIPLKKSASSAYLELKNLLSNRIKKGKLASEIDIFLNEDNSLQNFIAKGKIAQFEPYKM